MELEIISPGGVLFKGETDYVSFPGTAGSFDVLPHHAPMIAALEEGVIRVFDGLDNSWVMNRELIEGGIHLKESYLAGQDLEGYFMDLLGGAKYV